MRYRQSLQRAFGTVDPEGLLKPLMDRIAEIEADPSVADEFEVALAEARNAADPRVATEEVLFQVLGPNVSASRLAHVVPEARRLASIAAILVMDNSTRNNPLEPTAEDIASFAYKRVLDGNARVAAELANCRAGKFNDPVSAWLCLTPLVVDEFGGNMEGRLTKIVKLGCKEEKPGRQFLCDFIQDVEIYFTAGRTLSPDIIDGPVGEIVPGLVPQSPAAGAHPQHPAGRSRGALLRHAG